MIGIFVVAQLRAAAEVCVRWRRALFGPIGSYDQL